MPEWLAKLRLGLDDQVLDVGSGAGSLLFYMRGLGFTNLEGVDPYIDADMEFERIAIHKAQLSDLDGLHDLVMFHHSLEHMPDPVVALKEAARLTKVGKHILIRVPVAGTYAWRTYKMNWVQFDAPRHIFLHTEKSIKILANQAGLVLERVLYDSSAFQFWGSEQYLKDIPLRSNESLAKPGGRVLFSENEIARFEEKAMALNITGDVDQACFFLRRQ